MIDALVSLPHYLAHLAPVWQALDPAERGVVYVTGGRADQAASEGIGPVRLGAPEHGERPVLVASFQDHATARARGRPVVYLEHGAGQTYRTGQDPDPSYSGGGGHEGTVLFLSPSEIVADRWRARYPGVPAVAVGVPKLDAFHGVRFAADIRRSMTHPLCECHPVPTGRLPDPIWSAEHARQVRLAHPVIAVSFHSHARLCPETFGAWEHFSAGLRGACQELRARGAHLLGHAHPRLWGRLAPRWAGLGVEPVQDFAEILCRADLYCCDNSSTLPEAASCGIPLVWLNAPWFRREVEHGGRFWEWPQGQVSCDSAAELPDAALEALSDPPAVRAARAAMVAQVYAATDGRAAERAAEAIRAAV